jgi:pilus assembly protein CpaD
MSPIHSTIAKRRGAHALRLAALASVAVVLAACKTVPEEIPGATPIDYRQRHPIVLQEGPRTVELFIGEKRGTLNGMQRAQVAAFAGEWRREATGGIMVDVPSGTSNAVAAAQAAQEIRSILAATGVPPQAVEFRESRPNNPAKLATLKLHYPRVTADAGPCGLWPQDLGPTWEREHYENRQYWNLGCATQKNLAAMVDNPSDLVQPSAEIPPYTGRRTTVLEKYRRGEGTATVYPDADKGKISELGK